METKKISFGFSKVTKKPNILPSKAAVVVKQESKVELIKCLEGKEIKLVAGERAAVAPLVIQMPTSNQKTSTALASLMKRRAVLLGEVETEVTEEETQEPQSIGEVTGHQDLEQRAARELLAAAQANGSQDLESEKLVLPALKADELPLDGAKEASLDDYESIPIQQFGLAMLRGMGWVDPPPKKKGQAAPIDDAPFLRPKGMGLGADKALKTKALLVQPEKNEVLEIKKQAYVRILGGKQKDQYGQIEGFDDHAGRVIVKMAIGGAKEAFNEFLCQPVSRKEFAQYGKCINTAKYEEFKKQENKHGQIVVKQEKRTVKDEEREGSNYKPYKDEERKPFRTYKDEERTERNSREERKPFKSYRDEERTERKRDIQDTHEERKPLKSYKDEERTERKRDVQHTRGGSATSSSRHERRRSPSPRTSRPRPQPTQSSSDDEADDTGESTESDSDSAYERKKHKKKSASNKLKKKKSKKAKGKSSRRRNSSEDSDSEDSLDQHRRHSSKHKKKTKKSKHARSRSRSRSRGRGR